MQKNLNDPDNHDGVDTPRARHPGVWSQGALGSITMNKASGDDGIPAELFQIIFFFHIPHISGIMLFAFLCLAYFTQYDNV